MQYFSTNLFFSSLRLLAFAECAAVLSATNAISALFSAGTASAQILNFFATTAATIFSSVVLSCSRRSLTLATIPDPSMVTLALAPAPR